MDKWFHIPHSKIQTKLDTRILAYLQQTNSFRHKCLPVLDICVEREC